MIAACDTCHVGLCAWRAVEVPHVVGVGFEKVFESAVGVAEDGDCLGLCASCKAQRQQHECDDRFTHQIHLDLDLNCY